MIYGIRKICEAYEYGIRSRKTGEMHRVGMTETQATNFMDPGEWDGIDPTTIFEIVRRHIGNWESFFNSELAT